MITFTKSEIKALKQKSISMPFFFSDTDEEGQEYQSAAVPVQMIRKDGVPQKILIEMHIAGEPGKKNYVFNVEK